MTDIEGIYKATVQIAETMSPAMFVLKDGRFEGFDLNDRQYHGTYRQDPETLDVLLTADMMFWEPVLPGQPRAARHTQPFTVRLPAPPAEEGGRIAASLNMDQTQGSVVIERLSFLEQLA